MHGFFPKSAFEEGLCERIRSSNLATRYIVPPFSVFDARQGYWQERKRLWLALGIKSEIGRGNNLQPSGEHSVYKGESDYAGVRGAKLSPGGTPRPAMQTKKGHTVRGNGAGKELAATFGSGAPSDLQDGFKGKTKEKGSGTSIFDPVLCEIIYRWFSKPGQSILDPFAGGSVRGITAAVLGRKYTGIDLSEPQIKANREQAKLIVPGNIPSWIVGNSLQATKMVQEKVDLIFTCPPYYNLEVYSDSPHDISNMTWENFLLSYQEIIAQSLSLLKNNRFACFVVGDLRDKQTHMYRKLPMHTVRCFEKAGAKLYNDAVLLTAVGSLPLRTKLLFDGSRKFGRTHQNVLIFVKGDWKKAVRATKEMVEK